MVASAVLVVDEERRVLQTTESTLRTAGYSVSSATNAFDAFHLLRSHHYDLLLLDCIRDWVWVVQQAKRANPNTRIAVCTDDFELEQLPLVDIVFHKPVSPLWLLRKIAQLLCIQKAM